MDIEWWHWLVAGLALILAELAVPGMVFVWFGVAAVGVGLLVAVPPEQEREAPPVHALPAQQASGWGAAELAVQQGLPERWGRVPDWPPAQAGELEALARERPAPASAW